MRPKFSCSLLASAAAILAASPPAHADVTLLTQARTASALAYDAQVVPHQLDWAATDFAPASIVLEPQAGSARGYASHTSSLSPGLITTTMHTEGYHFLQTWDGWGRSELDITFRADAPTPFQLVGDWAAFGTGTALIELAGPGLSLKYQSGGGGGGSEMFDESGTLAAGDYRLHARMFASGSRGTISSGQSTINLQLRVPAPGSAALAGLALLGSARRRRA